MKQSEILEKLRVIGFKEDESKVLFALLKGGPMSASQIARESNIIRNSIYDILKSFVEVGYCNEIETNTILKYQTIDPQVIVDKIEKEFIESNKSKLQTLTETFSEIKTFYANTSGKIVEESSEQNIELIRGFNKHRQEKFIEIFRNAKKSVYGMYRLRGIVSNELNEIADGFIKTGGVLKSVYSLNLNFKIIRDGIPIPAEKEDLIRVCKNFENAGEQIRLSEMEIPNMVIFDEETVFNNISDKNIPSHKHADIIVKNKNNAKYMIDLFNYYWNDSMTIDEFKKKSY